MNFVHKKTTEIDCLHGKVVKTNSINWKLAEIQFQTGMTKKKQFLIELNSMRLTSVTGRFCEKARVYDLLRNRFHWLKFRGYSFDWKKVNGNQLNWFEVNQIEYHRRNVRGVCSFEVKSMETAFINDGRKPKPFRWRVRLVKRFHTSATHGNWFLWK